MLSGLVSGEACRHCLLAVFSHGLFPMLVWRQISGVSPSKDTSPIRWGSILRTSINFYNFLMDPIVTKQGLMCLPHRKLNVGSGCLEQSKSLLQASLVAHWKRICLPCRSRRRLGFDPWVRKILGSGHGNPFHYSHLESPIDREAWWATVCRVAKVGHGSTHRSLL